MTKPFTLFERLASSTESCFGNNFEATRGNLLLAVLAHAEPANRKLRESALHGSQLNSLPILKALIPLELLERLCSFHHLGDRKRAPEGIP